MNHSRLSETTSSSAFMLVVLCLWVVLPLCFGVSGARAGGSEAWMSYDNRGTCVDVSDPQPCDFVIELCSERMIPDDDEAYIPGDVDGDGNGPDDDDVEYLARYLYAGGGRPRIPAAADIDGSRRVDVNDLCLLIRRHFGDSRSVLEQKLRSSREQLTRAINARAERNDNAILLK